MSLLLGLLVFAGPLPINAVFALAVVAGYAAYIPPISLRLFRARTFAPGPFTLGRASKPVAAVAVAWMVLIGVVFLFPAEPGAGVQGMNYTVVVLGGVLLLALVWFYFPRVGGVHWFRGPVANTVVCTEDREKEVVGESSVDNEKKVCVSVREGSASS